MRAVLSLLAAAMTAAAASCAVAPPTDKPASTRPRDGSADPSLAWLAREVPRWSRENKCFSCHNNGDGARALFAAVHLGKGVPPDALADTADWLQWPAGWDRNGGEGPFSDKALARLQFAAALAEARAAGRLTERTALLRAAKGVAADQRVDGSWTFDGTGAVGSPAAWGSALATAMARRTLAAADAARFAGAIARADRWLSACPVENVHDSAAVLLAINRPGAIEVIRKGQGADGGWGPYANSAPEPFDTALGLMALSRHAGEAGVPEMIRRGRAWLLAARRPDGSWAETTRPPGADSYAQRVSTTGWAMLALLVTSER